ncbi:hypothetical protein ACS0TY_033687 [Phlomoides rotata]
MVAKDPLIMFPYIRFFSSILHMSPHRLWGRRLWCSSHIIVANYGDSRVVLYRGKESMALSVDHKSSGDSGANRLDIETEEKIEHMKTEA